ncbi:MAG: hypothetical protein K8R46_04950, partial [Pirellulales bacterium]|nr:hypothetical protein [Pirellulales bacterium]
VLAELLQHVAEVSRFHGHWGVRGSGLGFGGSGLGVRDRLRFRAFYNDIILHAADEITQSRHRVVADLTA